MQQGRFERLAPLSGVVFFVLIVVAIFVNSGSTPDVSSSAGKISAYYLAHRSDIQAGDIIIVISAVFLVWFTASLRSAVWQVEVGAGRLASLILAGGILVAGGVWVMLGLDFAIADQIKSAHLAPAQVKTLFVLSNDVFFPLLGGFGLLMLASGIGVIRTRALPVAFGWVALLFGLVCFSPIGFFAILASIIWIVVVSILLYVRSGRTAAPQVATGPAV
jgi:hypothetical protein